MKISNSGKTITVRMPDRHVGLRYKVTYAPNNVVLLTKCHDSMGHLVHSTNCMTLNSKHYPNWPIHGQIEVEHQWNQSASRYQFSMPDGPLPPVKVINRKKKALMVPQNDGTLGLPEELKSHQVSPLVEAMKIVERAGMADREPQETILPPKPEPALIEPKEEVILTIKGKTYMFNVPTEILLDTVLDWGSRGFGVR